MTDGCPDLSPDTAEGIADTDGDGYPDFMDLCPNQPEVFNGIDDKDGCPDDALTLKDSDQDGISDSLDVCPLEPETYKFLSRHRRLSRYC